MKIIPLVENSTTSSKLKAKHGLSLYIETEGEKLIFDIGPDKTAIQNAERMNIDLGEVSSLFLSHSHFDHSGGLRFFRKK